VRIHEHVLPQSERDPRTIARYRAKFEREIEPQLIARLEKTPFICGEEFSAADIMIGHNVGWARGYGMCRQEVFKAYQSRLSRRPAFLAAFADARTFKPEPPQQPDGRTLFNG
jgi:glutathione S-transferase